MNITGAGTQTTNALLLRTEAIRQQRGPQQTDRTKAHGITDEKIQVTSIEKPPWVGSTNSLLSLQMSNTTAQGDR